MKLETLVTSLELSKRLKELEKEAFAWKPVVGYENLYEVSNNGVVRSFRRSGAKGGIKYQGYNHDGLYFQCWLSKDNKAKRISVHRIVATAFITNPKNKPQINHKDGNRLNNSTENLEWCTREENHEHKVKVLGNDGRGAKNGNYGYRHSLMYPNRKLRGQLSQLGIPRNRHNLAELGEMLDMDCRSYPILRDKTQWECSYGDDDIVVKANTETNARALMLIYLLTSNLINVTK